MDQITLADLSVLLIEPSSVQQAVIKKKLLDQGITSIESTTNMKSALSSITKYPPDLVLTNLHYPDGKATDLLNSLKSDEKLMELPFILISTEKRREQLEIFKQSGVIAILSKPFPEEDLKKALNATLSFMNHTELSLENYDLDTMQVMVVDDSKLSRKAILRVLTNLGFENLEEFEDGSEAIKHLENHENIDLIVTDYNMPEVDGLELTKYIRQSNNHSHVPILMVTSESKDSHLKFVSEVGVNAISDKPFDAASVRKLLIDILGN